MLLRRSARASGHRSGRRERGAVTLEVAILFPFVLAFTFGVVEGALYYHARNVALAAAEEGVRLATADGGSVAAGANRAQQFAQEVGNGILSNVAVDTSTTATDVTFTVTGSTLSLVPGWGGATVNQTASAPIDRFTSPV